MDPLRIVLASVRAGGGHRTTRDALAHVLALRDPHGQRYTVERFESEDRSTETIYRTTMAVSPALQRFWWWLADQSALVGLTALGQGVFRRDAERILGGPNPPDVLVATHLTQALVFASVRHRLRARTVLVQAIPDYGRPARLMYPSQPHLRCDHLLAMHPNVARDLVERLGAPADRVHLCGSLTRPEFTAVSPSGATATTRASTWASLRHEVPELAAIDPDRPVVLCLGGALWAARTAPVVDALLARAGSQSPNVVFACGTNDDARRSLRERYEGRRGVVALGMLSPAQMARLMAVSDVPLLGSIAPATLHELLETGCGPLHIFRVVPGAEEAHVPFVEEELLGLYEPDADAMAGRVLEALGLVGYTPRTAALVEGFVGNAARVRAAHEARAMRFGSLVDAIAPSNGVMVPGGHEHEHGDAETVFGQRGSSNVIAMSRKTLADGRGLRGRFGSVKSTANSP